MGERDEKQLKTIQGKTDALKKPNRRHRIGLWVVWPEGTGTAKTFL